VSLTAEQRKTLEDAKAKLRDGILAELRTGKVDPDVNVKNLVAALRTSGDAGPRSLVSLYELAERTKSDADRRAFADQYSSWYAKQIGEVAEGTIADLQAKGKIPSKGTTVNEKPPVNQSNVERRVAQYDCRGHWWGMTPGFVSLTLIGAVAGLVKRSMK
jgi:hypothetical protein